MHDALRSVPSPEALCDQLERLRTGYRTVGVSDPALLMCWRTLHQRYPTARWVIVERPFDDVLASMQRLLPEVTREGLAPFERELAALKTGVSHMRVPFDRLTLTTCLAIAKHCNASCGPIERVMALQRLNVQVDPALLVREARALSTAPPTWVRGLGAKPLGTFSDRRILLPT